MQRVNRSTAVAALPTPPEEGTPGYFARPDPVNGPVATVPGYEWYNGVQEELVAAIVASGQTPDGLKLNQLAKAIQSGVLSAAVAGGTADAITAAFTPAIAVLYHGMTLRVRALGANTLTAPTFTPSAGAIDPDDIVKGADQPLVAGDIAGDGYWSVLQRDETLGKWVLLNPATGVAAGITQAQADARYIGIGYLIVQEQQASGVAAGAAIAGVNTRSLNTVAANTIAGASLSSNQITLPAGTYRINALTPSSGTNLNRCYLYNVTDAASVAYGSSENGTGNAASDIVTTSSTLFSRITIAAPKVFELRHYCQQAKSVSGLGDSVGLAGVTEIYSQIEIVREV